jgi:hypothetical protein
LFLDPVQPVDNEEQTEVAQSDETAGNDEETMTARCLHLHAVKPNLASIMPRINF